MRYEIDQVVEDFIIALRKQNFTLKDIKEELGSLGIRVSYGLVFNVVHNIGDRRRAIRNGDPVPQRKSRRRWNCLHKILMLLSQNGAALSNGEIAERLGIHVSTVRRAMRKIRSTTQIPHLTSKEKMAEQQRHLERTTTLFHDDRTASSESDSNLAIDYSMKASKGRDEEEEGPRPGFDQSMTNQLLYDNKPHATTTTTTTTTAIDTTVMASPSKSSSNTLPRMPRLTPIYPNFIQNTSTTHHQNCPDNSTLTFHKVENNWVDSTQVQLNGWNDAEDCHECVEKEDFQSSSTLSPSTDSSSVRRPLENGQVMEEFQTEQDNVLHFPIPPVTPYKMYTHQQQQQQQHLIDYLRSGTIPRNQTETKTTTTISPDPSPPFSPGKYAYATVQQRMRSEGGLTVSNLSAFTPTTTTTTHDSPILMSMLRPQQNPNPNPNPVRPAPNPTVTLYRPWTDNEQPTSSADDQVKLQLPCLDPNCRCDFRPITLPTYRQHRRTPSICNDTNFSRVEQTANSYYRNSTPSSHHPPPPPPRLNQGEKRERSAFSTPRPVVVHGMKFPRYPYRLTRIPEDVEQASWDPTG